MRISSGSSVTTESVARRSMRALVVTTARFDGSSGFGRLPREGITAAAGTRAMRIRCGIPFRLRISVLAQHVPPGQRQQRPTRSCRHFCARGGRSNSPPRIESAPGIRIPPYSVTFPESGVRAVRRNIGAAVCRRRCGRKSPSHGHLDDARRRLRAARAVRSRPWLPSSAEVERRGSRHRRPRTLEHTDAAGMCRFPAPHKGIAVGAEQHGRYSRDMKHPSKRFAAERRTAERTGRSRRDSVPSSD